MTKNLPPAVIKKTLPTKPENFSYVHFDDFVALTDKLLAMYQEIEKTCFFIRDYPHDVEQAKKLLDEVHSPQTLDMFLQFKPWQAWYDRDELYDFADGQRLGVKRSVVSQLMSVLTGSIQNKPAVPQIFGRAMVDDVHAARPNACALESAYREARRTLIHISIAEVLAILKKQESLWAKRRQAVLDNDINAYTAIHKWESRLVHSIENADADMKLKEAKRIADETLSAPSKNKFKTAPYPAGKGNE